ncbi:MAG TPA: thermostable hemolysin [Rhodocyclaceae bacterium]|nr:thermostable hemolysin [Rhodocyclaceae bacterium]
MLNAIQDSFESRQRGLTVRHTVVGSPRRAQGEAFVANVFERQYAARVDRFAPNLMLLENAERIVAVAGWRCAGDEKLFLETYLDVPVEVAVSRLAGRPIDRRHIVEVGNLASDRRGGSVDVILMLASHLDRLGFEWVVFTATDQLIGIFSRLGLPPLALASADPARLGAEAAHWGSYYATNPVVVAGRIRLALQRELGRG